MAEEKVIPYHRPDWAPALNNIYGRIVDQIGYITPMGTVHLLGVVHDNPDLAKSKGSSDEKGPTYMLRSDASGWV